MSDLLDSVRVLCPYCGEHFSIAPDLSGGDQAFIEDCEVCCRPIEFSVTVGANGELAALEVHRDDD